MHFANAAGGVILFGVDDNNIIRGISIDNIKRSSIQDSISDLSPSIYCPLSFCKIDDKEIAVIEVVSGQQKPYTLSGAIYIRQGPNSQKIISVEQMRDFFQQSGRIYFDEAICFGFNIATDIDEQTFEDFRIIAGLSPSVNRNQIISNLQLSHENGEFKNGAVLFFWKRARKIL